MSSPRKVGQKSPAKRAFRTSNDAFPELEMDSDRSHSPPPKRQQPSLYDSPSPSTSETLVVQSNACSSTYCDDAPLEIIIPTDEPDFRPELQEEGGNVRNRGLNSEPSPSSDEKELFTKLDSQTMVTSANLEWIANSEVRFTLSSLCLEPQEERYRPSAPIPSVAVQPQIIKPIPKRFTMTEVQMGRTFEEVKRPTACDQVTSTSSPPKTEKDILIKHFEKVIMVAFHELDDSQRPGTPQPPLSGSSEGYAFGNGLGYEAPPEATCPGDEEEHESEETNSD